ncbi:MAG: response regulator transcription factor, partial [Salinivirgaceae bacterium]|nr:response regulator transcription factor [Salinivirgaceae bacterium]
GHDYYSDSITQLLLNRYISSSNIPVGDDNDEEALSARQIEILKLWGDGFSNQEIADKLFISVRTVETHKNHIMQKLNLKSTVDLVKYAIKSNIIKL